VWRFTRSTWIGIGVAALGLVAMYFDHVAHGANDWAAFALGAVLILAIAGYVFGFLSCQACAEAPSGPGGSRSSRVCSPFHHWC
jgi:hypothetical protein